MPGAVCRRGADRRAVALGAPLVRALVVTNMYPSPERPALGSFVRDQVEALRRRDDVEIELFAFDPGLRRYPRAARELRRRYRGETRFDVVHAHFGLTAWPALAARRGPVVVTLHGNDLFHPRSRRISLARRCPSPPCPRPSRASSAGSSPARGRARRVAVLPVGIDLERFRPHPPPAGPRRARPRPATAPCLLFPHDPARPLKRADRARELAAGDDAAHARAHRPAGTSRCGSTPPTPSWCPPRPRDSGSR